MPIPKTRRRGRQSSGARKSPTGKKGKKSPRAENKWNKQNDTLLEDQQTPDDRDMNGVDPKGGANDNNVTEPKGNIGAAATMPPLEDSEDSSSDEDSEEEEEGGSIGDTDNDKTFNGFPPMDDLSTEDLNDLGKIASLLKTLTADMKDVKKNQGTVLSELKVIKKGHKKISKELKKQSKDIESLKVNQSVNTKSIENVEASVGNHERWLKSNDTRLTELEAIVGDLVLDSNVNGGKIKEYPYHRTVVALNVPYEDGENIMWKARNIINNFLELPDINIIRAKRKGLTDDKLGIVKMELPSEEAVDDVIKYKYKLKHMEDETINNIFIRQSQPDDTRRFQRNDRLLVKTIDPNGEMLKWLPSGDIVPVEEHGGRGGHNRGGHRGQRGPYRGHGGPGRGRGGPRGRGSGHARRTQRNQTPADYSKWTRSDQTKQSNPSSSNSSREPQCPPTGQEIPRGFPSNKSDLGSSNGPKGRGGPPAGHKSQSTGRGGYPGGPIRGPGGPPGGKRLQNPWERNFDKSSGGGPDRNANQANNIHVEPDYA